MVTPIIKSRNPVESEMKMDADILAQAEAVEQFLRDAEIKNIRANATLASGVAGECDYCGEHSLRLINGACAPCRDKRRLP